MTEGCQLNGPAPLSPQWLTVSIFHGTSAFSQSQAALFYIDNFFLTNHLMISLSTVSS